MIRYDWKAMSKCSPSTRISVLNFLVTKQDLVRYSKETHVVIANFTDRSAFLLNARLFLSKIKQYTDGEVYSYLELAALRSYIKYKETGNLRLPTYYSEYDINKLKLNTALTVTDEEIIFKYEEIKHG